jgi:hypothetical protein
LQEKKTTPAQVWDGTFPPANKNATFSGGLGTKTSPYEISTAADFAQLSADICGGVTHLGDYFILMNDILFNTASIDPALVNPNCPGTNGYPTPVNEWKPIGGAGAGPDEDGHSYCFRGSFDGGNHTIFYAFYNQSTPVGKGCNPANEVGIFGDITNEAEIKNLKTKGGYIGANISVGGIVGRTWGGDIINCHNENFVYGIGSQGAGGVAGTSWVYIPDPAPDGTRLPFEMTVINKCSNKATVVSNYFKNTTIPSGSGGGIVGENEGGVINCWNTGNISCRKNAGGIVGSNQNSSGGTPTIYVDPAYINNCYNTGAIGSTPASGGNDSIPAVTAAIAGGIMGYQTGSCQNVYNIGTITALATGGIVGQIIGELKIDTSTGAASQTNNYLIRTNASPYVGSIISGALGNNLYTFDSTQKNQMLSRLNTWVNNHPNSSYAGWTRDTTDVDNNGYPVLVLSQ